MTHNLLQLCFFCYWRHPDSLWPQLAIMLHWGDNRCDEVELQLTACSSEICWRLQGRRYKRCYEVGHSLPVDVTRLGWACSVCRHHLGRNGGNWNSINVWGKSTTAISFLTWCYWNFAGLFLILVPFENDSVRDVQNSSQPQLVGWGNRAVELLPCCMQATGDKDPCQLCLLQRVYLSD